MGRKTTVYFEVMSYNMPENTREDYKYNRKVSVQLPVPYPGVEHHNSRMQVKRVFCVHNVNFGFQFQ
jgi:hypothetical protein